MKKYDGPERRTGRLRWQIVKILSDVLEGKKSLGQEKKAYVLHRELGGGEVVLFKNMFRELDHLLRTLDTIKYGPLVELVHGIHFQAESDRENPDFKDQRDRF